MRSSIRGFVTASPVPVPARRPRRWWWRARLLVPAGVVLLVAVAALAAPVIAQHDPDHIDPTVRVALPSRVYPLGTDEYGRDIASRLVYGARISMIVSGTSVAIALSVGTAAGMAAGYFGGVLELVLMRFVDGLLSFPPILLALFVITFLGPSLVNVIVVIGLLYIPRFARIAHGATLSVRENEYVQAATAIGATHARVMGRAILPNIAAPLFVQVSLGLGQAILLESGLSFLGLGAPPPASSWGRMIEQSSRFMGLSPWPVLWPSIVVSATVLALNLLGDAMRDALDPRLRGRA
ncbi:MAG: ABC transporter permease [Armatimonadota bacterium]|nr:ABC transporter permease [Armatimonadota bacterium]